MFDMAAAADEAEEVLVEGVPPESYLERFAWDEAKYPPRRPLKETVAAITETVSMLEDQLKVRRPPVRQVLPAARRSPPVAGGAAWQPDGGPSWAALCKVIGVPIKESTKLKGEPVKGRVKRALR